MTDKFCKFFDILITKYILLKTFPIKKAAFQQPFLTMSTTLFHHFYNIAIVEYQQINTAGEIGCRNEGCSAF